jgi:heme/copper-type cytochrome/quinol oxidase subunit 3
MSAVSTRHAPGQSRRALTFFAVAIGGAVLSSSLAVVLASVVGRSLGPRLLVFPAAFWVSTFLLAAGSVALQRALSAVKVERQPLFRRWLWVAWSIGIAFVGVQSYALWCIMPAERSSLTAQSEATTFILALATLHALHFIVAVLFVSFVIVLAMSDRYDHEYHWGVTFCTGFWHFLGVAWLVVLAIIVIAYRMPTA